MSVNLLMGLSGCASRQPSAGMWDEATLPAAQALYDELLNRAARVKTLEGTMKLRIHTDERKARMDATLVCERPGNLRFEVTDFFDHVLFLAVIQKEYLTAYNVPENLYFQGQALPARIETLLGIPLRVDELTPMILGSPFILPLNNPVLSISLDQGMALLHMAEPSEGFSCKIRVDRKGQPIESTIEKRNIRNGETVRILVTFQKYKLKNTIEFPFRIRVTDEKSGWYFQIDYHEITLNRKIQKDLFMFTPPAGAERMVW